MTGRWITWRSRAGAAGAVVAACALAAGVTACGSNSDSSTGAASTSAGTGTGSSGGGTYKIGWAEAKTGYLALVDQPLEKGLRAEIARINDAGGIDGKYKIELETRDMKTDAATGATVAQELLSDGIDALITTCDTDVSLPGAQIAAQQKTPVISSCGAGAQFPQQVPAPYGFLNVSGTEAEGSAIAEYANKKGYKTAYVLSSNSEAYTSRLPAAFEKRFKELGGRIIGSSQYKIGDTDYRATATKIVAAKPDVIVPSAFPPDSIAFLKNLAAAGNKQPIILDDGNDAPAIFGAGSQLENSTLITYGGYTGPDSTAEQWLAAYKKMFGGAPESLQTALGGDLADALAAAVKAAGSTDGTKVATALRGLPTFPGATGPVTYGDSTKFGLTPGVPKKMFAVATFDVPNKSFKVVESFFPDKVVQ